MKNVFAVVFGLLLSSAAFAVKVPYCSIVATEGQTYLKFSQTPLPGVTPTSLCDLGDSELRFQYHLTPSGARSWGWIENAGQNYAWIKCNDNFVQYVNAFGLSIAQVLNQLAANHFQCIFHINHNG